ncbi:hypothetical protein [Helicobacter sp. T3_23-1056]
MRWNDKNPNLHNKSLQIITKRDFVMPKSSPTNEWERRHKPIDKQLESSADSKLQKGVDEQLEINISGRKFSISLKGFEPNAITEIKELLQSKNLDLLDLIRAYLNSVQSKCELESKIDSIDQKLNHALARISSQDTLQDFAKNIADSGKNNDTNSQEETLDEVEMQDNLEDFQNDNFGDFASHSGEAYGGFGEFGWLGGISLHDRREIDSLISDDELDRIMAQKENEYTDDIDEGKQSNSDNNTDKEHNKQINDESKQNNEAKSNAEKSSDTESSKSTFSETNIKTKSSKPQNDETTDKNLAQGQVDSIKLNQAQFDLGDFDTQILQTNENQKPNEQNNSQSKTHTKTPPNFDFLSDSATLRPISRPKKKKLDTTKQDLTSSLDSSAKSRLRAITKFFKS